MSDLETIRDHVAELEDILKNKFGAQGQGLGEYIRDVKSSLSPTLFSKLDKIREARNRLIHQKGAKLHNPQEFIRQCVEAKAELNATSANRVNNYSQQPRNNYSSYRSRKHNYTKTELGLVGQWIYANILGTLFSFIAIGICQIPWVKSLADEIQVFIIISLLFLGYGIPQQSVVSKLFNGLSALWAIATMAGGVPLWIIFKLMSDITDHNKSTWQHLLTNNTFSNSIIVTVGMTCYLCMGSFQSLILKQQGCKASLWIIANIIQGILITITPIVTHSILGGNWTIYVLPSILLSPGIFSIVAGMTLKLFFSSKF